MVKLDIVRASNLAVASSQPLVAVFVGVAGIAGYSTRALAKAHGKNGKGLRAYIIARKPSSIEELVAECRTTCPNGQFTFVQANDLALLKDVDSVCKKVIEMETKEAGTTGGKPRIDLLVMGQAIFTPWDSRKDTDEGIDTFMSLLYYSRMKFILNLLPLLLESTFPAHVISIFGPGRDTRFFKDDLSLRKNYSFWNSGCHVAYFTTWFFEHLAQKYPGKLALVHYYPGLVFTPAFYTASAPWWWRVLVACLRPIFSFAPMTLKPEESGERVLFNATPRFPAKAIGGRTTALKSEGGLDVAVSSDGVLGGGAYRGNYDGELVPLGDQYKALREEGWAEKIVQHTMKAFEDIEAGRPFTD